MKSDAILPLVIQKKFSPQNLNNIHMRQERTTLLTASCWWAGSKFIIRMLFYGTLSSYDGLAAFRATLLLLLSRRYMRRWVTHRLDKLLCWLLIDVQLRVQICLNLISFNLLRACCVIRHRTHEIRLQNQPKVICFISHDIHRKLLAVGDTNRNWSQTQFAQFSSSRRGKIALHHVNNVRLIVVVFGTDFRILFRIKIRMITWQVKRPLFGWKRVKYCW